MAALDYSFSQIEAFACIAEQGSLSKAALFLGKDRTTLRDLLDYLEDALGYRLFIREGRKLILTPQGQQLHRQAHLLLRQARAFESYAHSLRVPQQQELVMVYDPFIPAGLTAAITTLMSEQGIRFSAWSGSRLQAEAALSEGVLIWHSASPVTGRWVHRWSGVPWGRWNWIFMPPAVYCRIVNSLLLCWTCRWCRNW